MAESVTVLIAAGIIIPIVLLLIYAAFRNFFTSARNLKEAVEGELARRRKPDADQLFSGKSVQSEHRPRQTDVPREAADSQLDDLTKRQVVGPVSEMMANDSGASEEVRRRPQGAHSGTCRSKDSADQ